MGCRFDGDAALTVDAKLSEMRFTIGEKISIRRFEIREGFTGTYVHHDSSTAVVVCFDTTDAAAADPEFAVLAKNVALQIAGNTPPLGTLYNRQISARQGDRSSRRGRGPAVAVKRASQRVLHGQGKAPCP